MTKSLIPWIRAVSPKHMTIHISQVSIMNQHQSSPFLEGGIHVVVVMHQQQRGLFLKI